MIGSSPVTNVTLSDVTGTFTTLLDISCGEGARRAQITDKQTNAIAVHTTAGLGDRDPDGGVDSAGSEDMVWGLSEQMA